MSRTMVTVCGGEPTVSETVKDTLWWKESLLEGLGTDPEGRTCVLRGNITAGVEAKQMVKERKS